MGKLLSIIIHNNNIKIAELSTGKKGVFVSRLLTKEVPGQFARDGVIYNVKEFADFLTATLRYANIRTKQVVFSMPADKIMTREVVLPELSEDKIKATIQVNAAEYFPIDLSEYVLSYFTISKIVQEDEGDGRSDSSKKNKGRKNKDRKNKGNHKSKKKSKKQSQLRLMVLAAPDGMVQAYYDAARLAKLKLVALDYMGNSVFQLTANQIGEESCLVIQIDRDNTVLTIYKDNIMVLQRSVDFGSMAVIQAVSEQMDCDYEKAEHLLQQEGLLHDNFDDGDPITDSLYYLLSNIKRVIEYYAGRNPEQPLEQISLMGDGTAIEGIKQLLETQLNLPVEAITALKQVYVKEKKDLPMREVIKYMDNIGAVIEPINFLPKKLEQDMRRKLEAKLYRVMILLSLFASLIIITIPAGRFFTIAMETLDLKNRLVVLEDVKPVVDNYKQAEARYGDVKTVQAYAKTNNESLRAFIDVFEQLRPSNISITSFSCGEGEISFTALAGGKKTVAKLIQQLNMVANVSQVKVSNLSSSFEGNTETVAFSLTCRLVNEAAVLGETSQGDTEMGVTREQQEIYDHVNERLSDIPGYEFLSEENTKNNTDESVGEGAGEGAGGSAGEGAGEGGEESR